MALADDTTGHEAEDWLAASGRPLGAISTLTSLFLLLLVFFILLFSVAATRRDAMTRMVASLDNAFGGIPTMLGVTAAVDPDANAPANFVDAVTQLITGFGAPRDAEMEKGGAGILVTLAASDQAIFKRGSDELTERAKAIAVRLAALLQRHPTPDQLYRLHLRVPQASQDGSDNSGDATAKAANFAAALYLAGCQTDRLTISADGKEAGRIVFEFTVGGRPATRG